MVSWGTTAGVSIPVPHVPPPSKGVLVTRGAIGGYVMEAGLSSGGAALAWVAELRERKVALDREAEEAAQAAARAVVAAHLEMDAARRMHEVAVTSSVPLSSQAANERIRLYESGRGDFAEVIAAYRRFLQGRLDEVTARYEYGEAEARAWMAAGARPAVVTTGTGGAK